MLSLKIDEAMKKFYMEFPTSKILSVVDYDKWFIFNYIPVDAKIGESYIITLIGIEKATGNIIGFNPLDHDPDKYFKTVEENILIF